MSVSESELVEKNVSCEPKAAELGETEPAVKEGTWLTLNGESPWFELEHREPALWSQTNAYQTLLSASPAWAV